MILALNGVENAFSEALDRAGLTPKARAQKIREEEERFLRRAIAQLEEWREKFQQQLDRLDQASMEALRENEEHQRAAQEELRKIRERAYEITMPDGTVAKVYRDGDKVRTEAGTEVESNIVRAEDLGAAHPTWSDFTRSRDRIEALQNEHEKITAFRKTLRETQERAASGDLSADEMQALSRKLDKTMPDSVRHRYDAAKSEADGRPEAPTANPAEASSGLTARFAGAASTVPPDAGLSEQDFDVMRPIPPASAHAPR